MFLWLKLRSSYTSGFSFLIFHGGLKCVEFSSYALLKFQNNDPHNPTILNPLGREPYSVPWPAGFWCFNTYSSHFQHDFSFSVMFSDWPR
uniref:Uncharacterized protein n=1 Tax=Anguilla anguilla TaxID=7936 RepID=A0A0E9X0T9_ANGAN